MLCYMKNLKKIICVSKFSFTLVLGLLFSDALCTEWFLPNNQEIPTIYYQGIKESQVQCSKYTGSRGFITTTGEYVVCTRSIDVIHRPYIGHEIDEISPRVSFWSLWKKKWSLWNFCSYLFFHISHSKNEEYGIVVTPACQEQLSHTIMGHSLDLTKVNLGQDGDVKNHHSKHVRAVQDYGPDHPKIFYGVSRGAATTFNAMAKHKYENVRLVVLEGCFDSLDGLISAYWPTLYALGFFNLMYPIVEMVTSYKRTGMSPITMVEDFPQEVPVLFISSEIDIVVPHECTKRLAQALVKAGHKQVYFLSLKNSCHVGYISDDEQDKILYQQVVHALYKKLGLPYIPAWAEQGQDKLELYHLKDVP